MRQPLLIFHELDCNQWSIRNIIPIVNVHHSLVGLHLNNSALAEMFTRFHCFVFKFDDELPIDRLSSFPAILYVYELRRKQKIYQLFSLEVAKQKRAIFKRFLLSTLRIFINWRICLKIMFAASYTVLVTLLNITKMADSPYQNFVKSRVSCMVVDDDMFMK